MKLLKTFSIDQKLILVGVACLFLPYQVSAAILIGILLQALFRKELICAIKNQVGSKFFYAFVALELIVCLFYKNSIGFINTGMFLIIGAFGAYYRKHITQDMFDCMCDIIIGLSIVVAIYGLYQFYMYSIQGGYSFFQFHIFNSPSRRIKATFMNANIYAMMIDFFCLLCMYRFVQVNKISLRILYFLVAVFNFFVLYLTGSRTALLPFLVIFPIFLGCVHWKKLFWTSIICEGLILVLVCLKPNLIPRINDMSTFASRIKIWKTAFICISMYPIFGWGPQTYLKFYPLVNGHKAPHAHNIYIDSILSYGVVGTFLILCYTFILNKEIIQSNVRKENKALFALMMCFIAVVLIYGLLDCTLNIVATGTLCFLILNSSCMYLKK